MFFCPARTLPSLGNDMYLLNLVFPETELVNTRLFRPGTSCSTTSSTTGKTSLLGDEDKEQDNLDKFLANHTSEDNESFFELQKEAEKKHRYIMSSDPYELACS